MKKIAIALAFLVIATLACGVSPTGQNNNGSVPVSNPTQSNVLFSDNFSDSSSGWGTVNQSDQIIEYAKGGLRLWLATTQYDIWTFAGQSFTGPVSIEVDATKLAGPDNNDFGILCDVVDESNFYYALVSNDGYAIISKKVDGTNTALSNTQMVQVNGIYPGTSTNHIRFDCNNGTLTLYANGNLVATANDTSFNSGDIGLRVGTFDESGVDILFNNLVVKKP